jgi:hypothetical protein
MVYRTRFGLILIFFTLSPVGFVQGPRLPQGTNYYNPNDETLNLPRVYIIPPNSSPTKAPQYLFNARFKSQGDNIFELMSVDELQPEQECSRAEVLNAISALRLNMTVDEGNGLIGCTANINRGQADLETGLLVNASWTGIDGALHNSTSPLFNPFTPVLGLSGPVLGGLGGDWRPVAVPRRVAIFNASGGTSPSFSYTSNNFGYLASSPFGAPFINLAPRENVVESTSDSTGGMTDGVRVRGAQIFRPALVSSIPVTLLKK